MALLGAITDPIITHVNDFGALLLAKLVGDLVCCTVVCLSWDGWLGMAHGLENVGQNFGFAAIDE